MDTARVSAIVRELLVALGEDPERDGLRKTPERVAQHWAELLTGMAQDAPAALGAVMALGEHGSAEPVTSGAVLLRDIRFRSVCEHHLLPFAGRAHIAYLPGAHAVGFGSIIRLVEILAGRPQVQERLGEEIAATIDSALAPRGTLVVLDAAHQCVTMRGGDQELSSTLTIAARGIYAEPSARAEVVSLIASGQTR